MKHRKFLAAAPLLVLALAVGGTAFASGFGGGPHNGAHGYGPHGALRWGFGRFSAPLGMVQSFSNGTLTVLKFDGTTSNFTVQDSTQIFLNGSKAGSSAIVTGENVIVFAPRSWSGKSSSSTPVAQVVWLISPHVVGSVQSVTTNSTGELIVVQDPQGFWHSIQTDSSTVYYDNGTSSSTAPTFTTGEILAALGSVASDHLTLDATQVNVVPPHKHH